MDNNVMYEHIPQEKFEFAQLNANIHDKKLQTKSRGYLQDAFIRFKKNKSSVVAAWIILLIFVYALLVPLFYQLVFGYDVIEDKDTIYVSYPPYIENSPIPFFNGSTTLGSQDERQVQALELYSQETKHNVIIQKLDSYEQSFIDRGKPVTVTYTKLKVNAYYMAGMKSMTVSLDEYKRLMEFQNETGIQVLYPIVLKEDVYPKKLQNSTELKDMRQDQNIWYKVSDLKGNLPTQMKRDENGKLVYDADGKVVKEEVITPAYCTDAKKDAAIPYTSLRIDGDEGNYIYGLKKGANGDSVQIRYYYYNYYKYQQWLETGRPNAPMYLMGTNAIGQDLCCAIGVGARFSIIFAICVSAINLFVGAIYGAIQGYFGGWVDMILDRISDILSNVPTIVVVTLFNLHLAAKIGSLGGIVGNFFGSYLGLDLPFLQNIGSVGAFLLAFMATGWIGMAALTRKQFYRFKNMEHVMAARTLGASDWRLMFKHIFPNSLGTIVTSCALVIPGVIGSETSLTYLGIIDLSSFAGTTIGTLMEQGQNSIMAAPHAMLFPSIFFALLMISFNLFGNGLRDAFNPATRGTE